MSPRTQAVAVILYFLTSIVCLHSFPVQAQRPVGQVDFARDIQPILQTQGVGCHGPARQLSQLRLPDQPSALRVRSSFGVLTTTVSPTAVEKDQSD